jgi:beta-glucosidase
MRLRGTAAAFCMALALCAQAGARAACPASPTGQAAPPQAIADYLDNAPWRERVATLDRALAGSARSSARVVFLGDSITEAWDPALFAQSFGRYGALNLGVRGDTTQGLLWRLPRIGLGRTVHPALIVLLIGTNNLWPNGDAAAVAIGVGEVVRSIRRLSPDSKILLLGILPRGPDETDPWRQMGRQVNKLIASCGDGRTVFYAEPGRGMIGPDGRLPTAIAGDSLHPTRLGYAILAEAMKEEVARRLP